ncbi:MAG: hypothetical protein JO039_20125 [Solirubrobacterales bacterium]|nr:hypothetical protein [Solirubrobacterales bacterium]
MTNDQHLEGANAVPPRHSRRVRAAAKVPRELVRIAYRDPEHVCERMTLYACQRLAAPARAWAQRTREAHPEADLRELADGLGVQSARIARIEGAVAGTPFYVALIPGYLNYLWQELRMTLRLAALHGRDPATLTTAAEALWLRGVYPSVQSAEAGLVAVQTAGLPPKPWRRRSPRVWIRSGRLLLVFGGFLSPPSGRQREGLLSWWRDALGLVAGAVAWMLTWFFPATFMIAMAWGCHSHARRVFRTAADHYDGKTTPSTTRGQRAVGLGHYSKRELCHGAAFSLSIMAPIGFLVYATYIRQRAGINTIGALGILVAASLVIAASMYGRR